MSKLTDHGRYVTHSLGSDFWIPSDVFDQELIGESCFYCTKRIYLLKAMWS